MQGYLSVNYVDDSYLQGDYQEDCYQNTYATINLFTHLGYTIHFDKSILDPTQEMEFLGFILNSKEMSITITLKKEEKILIYARRYLTQLRMPSLLLRYITDP